MLVRPSYTIHLILFILYYWEIHITAQHSFFQIYFSYCKAADSNYSINDKNNSLLYAPCLRQICAETPNHVSAILIPRSNRVTTTHAASYSHNICCFAEYFCIILFQVILGSTIDKSSPSAVLIPRASKACRACDCTLVILCYFT